VPRPRRTELRGATRARDEQARVDVVERAQRELRRHGQAGGLGELSVRAGNVRGGPWSLSAFASPCPNALRLRRVPRSGDALSSRNALTDQVAVHLPLSEGRLCLVNHGAYTLDTL
jgi:hypothetical protein